MNIVELALKLRGKASKTDKALLAKNLKNQNRKNKEYSTAVRVCLPAVYKAIKDKAEEIEGAPFTKKSWRKAALRAFVTGEHSKCGNCDLVIPSKLKFCTKGCAARGGASWNPESRAQRMATNNAKYGGNSPFSSKKVRALYRAGMEYRYGEGVTNPSQIEGMQDRKRANCLEKYGVDNPLKDPEVRRKACDTLEARTGYRNPLQDPKVRAKIVRTNLKRYGVRNVGLVEAHQAKAAATNLKVRGVAYPMQSEDVRARSRDKCLEVYGYDNVLSSPKIRAKVTRTLVKHHGVTNPQKNAGIKARSIATYKAKTGYSNPGKNPSVRRKMGDTLEARTGFRYALQNPVSMSNCRTSSFSTKMFKSPTTGKLYECQGYEPQLLRILDARGYKYSTRNVGYIPYKDEAGNSRVYHPDVKAVSPKGLKLLLEVKSVYTLNGGITRNLRKFRYANKFCKEHGAVFRLVVVFEKGRTVSVDFPTLTKLVRAGLTARR